MPKQAAMPTEQEWHALYRAANEFRTVAPWDVMLDSDMFGIRNPETGELGYCCVMGNLGEHFALAVYLGDEGLRGYKHIQETRNPPSRLALMLSQHCLMASYEDRDFLDKRDYAQIKSLGLKYRGRNAWPQFRNYTPGYFPWYVLGAEARFLTLALQQGIVVAQRFAQEAGLLDSPEHGQILVRVATGDGWDDTWHTPDLAAPSLLAPPHVDEVRLQRLKQGRFRRAGIWETDHFYFPQPTQDHPDERPYYATACMFVDGQSGMILPPRLAGPADWRDAYQTLLIDLIEQLNTLPQEIALRSTEVQALLTPVAEPLGIKLRMARRLPALDMARDSLQGSLGGF